jgi:hypothetical protein
MIRKHVDILAIGVLLAGILLFGRARMLVLEEKPVIDRIVVANTPCFFSVSL